MPRREPVLVEQLVYTSEQAAAILGIERQSVVEAVKRSEDNGRPVSWGRGDPGNPMNTVLVLAEWVDYAATNRNGIQVELPPARVPLPLLKGMTNPGDLRARLDEAVLSSDLNEREAHQERIRRLEQRAEIAESEAARLRKQVASLGTLIAESAESSSIPDGGDQVRQLEVAPGR